MISGASVMIFSKDAEADRAFLRDVVGLAHVDAGGGWLIFGLPSAELSVHPAEANGSPEFYLMSDDLAGLAKALDAKGVACAPFETLSWGQRTRFPLPGGSDMVVYQPHHARP